MVIPQPSAAALAQLTEMGFAEQLSRNALQLQRNNVAAALDWLLQHGEEPGAAEPLSEERLQQVSHGATSHRHVEPQCTVQWVAPSNYTFIGMRVVLS